MKLLYVAATRALHELAVLYLGKLTKLIAEPVPEEKKQKILAAIPKPAVRYNPGEDSRTNREIEMERAREGHREMALRNKIGPRRVSAQNLQSHTKETITSKASATAAVLVKPVKKAETGHPKFCQEAVFRERRDSGGAIDRYRSFLAVQGNKRSGGSHDRKTSSAGR